MSINLYNGLNQPQVINTTSLKYWIQQIKFSQHSNEIEKIRSLNLSKDDLGKYKLKFPCITPNFIYNNYKQDSNIIGSTGYIYIDIDKSDFNIGTISGKTAAYNKSFSGKGYSVYVAVSGVTVSNFKSTYQHLVNELAIDNDTNAVKHSQFNVLSFDPDAYYNDNPIVFGPINNTNELKCIPIVGIKKKEKTYTHQGDTKCKVRFDNLDEIDIPTNERYKVDWNGIDYIKCWLPIRKLKDGRKRFMLSYTTNLVYLNQSLDHRSILNILSKVNETVFHEPLPVERLKITIETILKQLKEDKLQPIWFKRKRKIVFNSNEVFQKDEKRDIALTEISINRVNATIEKIKTIINTWNFNQYGKITARKIHAHNKISFKTVCKYYKHFSVEIKKLNKQH